MDVNVATESMSGWITTWKRDSPLITYIALSDIYTVLGGPHSENKPLLAPGTMH